MQGLKAKFVINIVGALSGILIALITVPMYVSRIGEDRYGILSLVWILLGYLGFLDFGLTRATTNALAKLHDAPLKKRGSVFMTSLWINLILGSVGGLIIYFAGGHILLAMHGLTGPLRTEVEGIMPWVAPMLPLSLIGGVSIGALESRERFLLANIFQIVSNVLGQVVPLLVAIYVSPNLTAIIPVTFVSRLVMTAITMALVIGSEKLFHFERFDIRQVKKLLGYGIWVTLTNVISPLMTSLDQFVIGNMIGPSFVARYAVPMTAATRLQIFNGALSRSVFPRFSRMEHGEASALAAKGIVTLAYLSAMLSAPALVVAHPFFEWWMGKTFALYAVPVAMVLFVGAWFNGLAFIPYTLLQGQGKPGTVAKLHTAEVLPYIGCLWLFVHVFGLTGAAMAWALRVMADAAILAFLSRLPLRGLLPAMPAALGIVAGLVLGKMFQQLPVIALFVIGTMLALSIGGIGLWVVPDMRKMAIKIWSRLPI